MNYERAFIFIFASLPYQGVPAVVATVVGECEKADVIISPGRVMHLLQSAPPSYPTTRSIIIGNEPDLLPLMRLVIGIVIRLWSMLVVISLGF